MRKRNNLITRQSKLCRNIVMALVFLLVFAGIWQVRESSVSAAGEAQKSKLTIICPVDGMKISLYHVADLKEDGSYELAGALAGYSVSLACEDEDDLQGAANTLADYVKRDQIIPEKVEMAKTTSAGISTCFEDISQGMYLVMGQNVEKQEGEKTQVYTPQVALVVFPANSGEQNPYDVKAVLKYERREKLEESQTKLHVLKVWKGDKEEKRPTSVKVDLLKLEADGSSTVADRQVLNQENQWSYTWENLSTEAQWSVAESQVPAGYYVSTNRAESTIVVTNTAKQPVSDKKNTQDQSKKQGAKLPQTGQLWWPVLVLLLAGISCIVIGCSFSRTNNKKIDK